MRHSLSLDILAQPNDFTCGPACLHAVYRYYGDDISQQQVIDEVQRIDNGGTLGSLLARHAQGRGYRVRIYTYNVLLFDPTWFLGAVDLIAKLRAQAAFKQEPRLQVATQAYVEFLQAGGEVRLEDLTPGLLRRYLDNNIPILTGLSSTYLYRSMREYGPKDDDDDIRGEPAGHFVVLRGYDAIEGEIDVADPQLPNPLGAGQHYSLPVERVMCAILLGLVTYDANLLIIQPAARL